VYGQSSDREHLEARINDARRASVGDAIRQCPYGARLPAARLAGLPQWKTVRGQTANGRHFRPQHRTATRISRKWTQIGTRCLRLGAAPAPDKMSLSHRDHAVDGWPVGRRRL